MSRPRWEILVGSAAKLDYLMQDPHTDEPPHPLQEVVEDVIASCTEREREVFLLRYGDEYSIRQIAEVLGYNSHQVVQVILDNIKEKVRRAIEDGRTTTHGDADSVSE